MEQKTLNRISFLTSGNNHGEAYLVAAKALGSEDLAERFTAINRRHTELGYLPVDLHAERYAVYEKMMELSKRTLAPEMHQRLYMSL
jgi:hypothetical protein